MSDAAETAKQAIEHAREDKRVALLIAVLALALALTEVVSGEAKTEAQLRNVEGANLWAFFQAKTTRQAVIGAEADRTALDASRIVDPQARAALEELVRRWRDNIAHWESEPETREGSRELMVRAHAAEVARDRALREDRLYDLAAAAIQLGIVLASAAIITATPALAWVGGMLGLGAAVAATLTYVGLV